MNLELAVEERSGNINLGVISIKMILKMMILDEIIQGEKVGLEEGMSTSWKAQILTGLIQIYSLGT